MLSKPSSRMDVTKVLICIFLNPHRHLVRRWNGKTACMSAFSRGIVVLIANLSAGGASAAGAMSAEIAYRALTSGFYSALTQAFRFAQPAWAASLIPMALVPLLGDSLELVMHRMRGTERYGATAAASLIFTAISTFLELFAMKRGVLVVGCDSGSLLEDLKRIPEVVCDLWQEGSRVALGTLRALPTGRFLKNGSGTVPTLS